MSDFNFPKPGELVNRSAIPVPIEVLRALLAGALAWEISTEAAHPGILPPQLKEATNFAMFNLTDADCQAAARVAERLMEERDAAEVGM